MAGILCAVRGGPDSQATIAQAISLAKQTGLPLNFIYIVNLDFLTHTTRSRVHVISKEMRQMGEFILLTARSSAAAQGVTAGGMVRQGDVGAEIVTACHELGAEYLVLGRPRFEREESLFTQELLTRFIAETEKQTGATVVFPPERDPS